MPPYENSPGRSIVLEKTKDSRLGEPCGAIYEYTYKSLSKDEAARRARIAFQRDCPHENFVNWKVNR